MLSEKKLFLFDIDGTVALGDVLLPGAAENRMGHTHN